ncbi:MAG TPA: 16S rRNA (cytosine(967)-C(5))-methyltransferase RsmB [Pyrinomonadaceae bacterium]|nr:16S rRNA (cytosine(967)-C(5))-methyltransferase RsmB [Pyrinomonadaceae bacterium]
MKISPSRIAAFEILSKIETEKSFSSVLLPIYEEKLEPKDRALCHELTLGTLRKQIYLDCIIEKLTKGKKLDSAVKIILRIALYQLIFLDKIPAHAAINDSVNLVQMAKKTSAKGFVNAVLRRFTREKIELDFADETEKISVESSHPKWLIEKWIGQFGFEETARLAEANNETPKLSFRFTAKTSDAIKQAFTTENVPTDKKYLRELAENGKIYFQDEGSQIIGNAVELKENDSFLDVCAAPGSKVTQIGSKFQVPDSRLIAAGDLYWQRVKVLQENCRNQSLASVSILQYDAENALPFADESFDVVLIDAPCSGTGTIRHNPEIRYFLQEKDFSELASKQLKILNNASKLIKSGGRIIYSTCSLEKEENEGVCGKFLAENAGFRLVDPNVPAAFLTAEGFARTFPQRDKMDGFFIAVFEKI